MSVTHVGERVQLAREAAGLTQQELAAAADIAQGTLSAIETGFTINPSEKTVASIARGTGYPLSFFYLGPMPDFPDGSFRRLRRGTSRSADQIRAQVRCVAESVQRAESLLPLPPVLLKPIGAQSELSLAEVERLTASVRQYLRVGELDPIPHLTRAVERAGVIVMKMPVAIADHFGFSVWPDYGLGGRPIIALTRESSGDRLRFSLAHELGHLLLHTNRLNFDRKTVELEANRFAGALLVPKKVALTAITIPVTLGTLMPVKAKTGASLAMLAKRALDLGIIDQQHFVSLRKQLSSRGWTNAEPVEVVAEDTLLIGRILDALGGQGSWSDRAARVGIPPFNLRALASG